MAMSSKASSSRSAVRSNAMSAGRIATAGLVFALGLAAKDAGLFIDVARQAGVPVPVSAQIAQALVGAVAAGLGGSGFTDLVELVERTAGVELTLSPPRS